MTMQGPDQRTVERRFRENYIAYQYAFVEFLTEHLCDVSRAFDGDMQEMMVLAIIGQMHLRALAGGAAAKGDTLPERGISASRIADVTAIARQTIRRKLKSLETRGWIERTPNASFRLALTDSGSSARRDLTDTDQRAMERIAKLYCTLHRLLATAPSEPA
jgi:DNA-binding MarR family transcriptional regulator